MIRHAATPVRSFGVFPEVALVTSIGLIILALAFTSLRLGGPLPEAVSEVAFWIGLLLITLPTANRLLGRSASRLERISLVVLMGLALYIMKILRDPIAFTRYDELLHWRTAFDIDATGRLFETNSLLVVSPVFPGLEANTVALMQVGGADVFSAGIVVIAVARIALVLALFLLYEKASGSAWLAGIATGIYMANPSFIYFSSTYVYESMGLAVAAGVLLLTVRRQEASGKGLTAYTVAVVLAVAALVVTHHITTLATIGILALLSTVSFLFQRRSVAGRRATEVTVLCAGLMLVWLFAVAQVTFAYLGPPIIQGAEQMIGLISGEDVLRPLFTSDSGTVAPAWERMVALGATGAAVVGLLIGVVRVWRGHRGSVLALVFAALALAYPVILVVRATQAGGLLAARSSSFVFLGVAFAMALAVGWVLALDRIGISVFHRRLGMVAVAGILVVGGLVLGSPPWQRLPGPFLVGADSRSITVEALAMADWAPEHLGSNRNFGTDRTNRLLLGSYGQQKVVFAHGAGVAQWAVFVTDEVGPSEQAVLARGLVDYVVIDRRLSDGIPFVGYYYEKAEGARRDPDQPMRDDQLDNFDEVDDAGRIYDSGELQIYDVRGSRP